MSRKPQSLEGIGRNAWEISGKPRSVHGARRRQRSVQTTPVLTTTSNTTPSRTCCSCDFPRLSNFCHLPWASVFSKFKRAERFGQEIIFQTPSNQPSHKDRRSCLYLHYRCHRLSQFLSFLFSPLVQHRQYRRFPFMHIYLYLYNGTWFRANQECSLEWCISVIPLFQSIHHSSGVYTTHSGSK